MGAELSVPSPGDEVLLFAYAEGEGAETLWTLINVGASGGMVDLTAGIATDLNLSVEGIATLQWMSSSNNIQLGKMCVGGAHVDDLPPVLKNPFAGGAKSPTTGIEIALSESGEDTASEMSHSLLGAGDTATGGNDIFDGGLLEFADMLSMDAGDGVDMLVVEDANTDLADLEGSNLEVVNLGVDPSGKATDNTLELSAADILDLASTEGNRLYVTGDVNDTVKISDLDAAGTVDGWQVYDSAFLAVQLFVQEGVSVESAESTS